MNVRGCGSKPPVIVPPGGTFPADVTRYLALESIKRMPTFVERRRHLQEWIQVFGEIRRRTITALMIEQQRDAWMEHYSAASVNKRLRALSNVFTKLDGRRAPNPVLDVAECEEPDPAARGLPYDVIEAILAEIPDTYIGTRKDGTRTAGKGKPRPAQNKARLRVIAYTGLSHSQLKLLTPDDVDLEAGTMRLIARRKGRKIRRAQDRPLPELLPLIAPAVLAFREYARLNCWGSFSNSSMWKLFQRACKRLGLTGLRPYDFRHSMLSVVYSETRDLRVTGRFGGHRAERTTRRYTISAVAPHVAEAAEKVRLRLASDLKPK
jgi:integrase